MEQGDDAGCVAERHELVESRMRWKSHVRFGGRAGETDQPKGRHRAPVRSHWASRALDEVRKDVWRTARRQGQRRLANTAHRWRFTLWKNPDDLTPRQAAALAEIAAVNEPLYRAYLLKEQIRQVFTLRGPEAVALLDEWLSWARRCRLKPFVDVAALITKHRVGIEATLTYGLSNGLIESVNTRIRLITRIAFGFRSVEALISLAFLKTGGCCPPLPGRTPAFAHG